MTKQKPKSVRLRARHYQLSVSNESVGDLEYKRINKRSCRDIHQDVLNKVGINLLAFHPEDVVILMDKDIPEWVVKILDESVSRIMTRYHLAKGVND